MPAQAWVHVLQRTLVLSHIKVHANEVHMIARLLEHNMHACACICVSLCLHACADAKTQLPEGQKQLDMFILLQAVLSPKVFMYLVCQVGT